MTEDRPQFKARGIGSDQEWDKLVKVELFLSKRIIRNLMGAAADKNAEALMVAILTDVSQSIEEDND